MRIFLVTFTLLSVVGCAKMLISDTERRAQYYQQYSLYSDQQIIDTYYDVKDQLEDKLSELAGLNAQKYRGTGEAFSHGWKTGGLKSDIGFLRNRRRALLKLIGERELKVID